MQETESENIIQGTFNDISNCLLERYGANNLLCILAYGTMVTNPEMTDQYSDYDVTAVFKNYPTAPLPNLPQKTNLTTLFWPEIQLGGVKFFRLYSHGPFYVHVLAGAIAIHGINPFKELIPSLSQKQLRRSLAEQVLVHCSKLSMLAVRPPSPLCHRDIVKYSFRIVQNFYFLKKNKVDYGPFYRCTFLDWIYLFESSRVIPSFACEFLREMFYQKEFPPPDVVLKFIYRIKEIMIQTWE